MTDKEKLREARKRVFFSYLHKSVLLAAAWGGFVALHWLGEQKDNFKDTQDKRWMVPVGLVGTVRQAAPCAGESFLKQGYATRSDLIAAVQEKSESCIRRELDSEARKIRGRIAEIEGKDSQDPEDLKTYGNLWTILEKRETYARAKVLGERQHIGAVLRYAELRDSWSRGKGFASSLRSTFDEESNTHVIYQILWYGVLIFALGAATLLLVIVLTALPITDGEGYWTKRIGEALDRLPGTTKRTIAAPLLAATLGASTFAGAVTETRPGGQAWNAPQVTVEAPRSGAPPVQAPAPPIESPAEGDLRIRGGDLYIQGGDLLIEGDRPIVVQPPKLEWKVVAGPLIASLNNRIDVVVKAAQDSDGRLQELEHNLSVLQQTSGDMLACLNDLRPVIERVEDVDRDMFLHAKASQDYADDVEGREERQAKTSTESLAQSTEVDPRGTFARNFLWTVYKVGPLVPRVMEARLDRVFGKAAFLAALQDMKREEPMRSKKFLETIGKKLATHGLSQDQIRGLMNGHSRALLRVCALPRR